MALAAFRNSPQLGNVNEPILTSVDVPVAANAILFCGGIAALNSAGFGVAGAATAALVCVGGTHPNATSSNKYDATGLSSGALVARVDQGVFLFLNSASTDLIAQADFGHVCYLVDDQTVAKTDNAGARPAAGIVVGIVGTTGVYVAMGLQFAQMFLAQQIAGGGLSAQQISTTPAVVSVVNPNTVLAVSGTMALTLADGVFIGQIKRLYAKSAASTPNCVVTVAHLSDSHTTITFDAAQDSATLCWNGTAWDIVQSNAVTIA